MTRGAVELMVFLDPRTPNLDWDVIPAEVLNADWEAPSRTLFRSAADSGLWRFN